MKKIDNLASDKNCYNIWRYAHLFHEFIEPPFRLTQGEGWTQEINLSRLAHELKLNKVWLKRDDLNPTGSHKARSLCYQVSKYFKENHKKLLISSSGNAASAGASYSKLADIDFFAFISPFTEKSKVDLLKKFGAHIIITSIPINMANYVSRVFNIINLRPSVNDTSLEGYKSISFELAEKGVFPDAVFVCPTSASTLVGIGRAYQFLEKEYGIKIPQIHSVQYGDVSSLIEKEKTDSSNTDEKNKNIKRLGVKHTSREEEARTIINSSGGRSWFVNYNEITAANSILNNFGIATSEEGTATVAGLIKAAKESGFKSPLCLLTGHYSQWENKCTDTEDEIYKIEKYIEAKELFEKNSWG